jgi:tRNA-2-methylthio-N6-dimethylallyladenosine synthase
MTATAELQPSSPHPRPAERFVHVQTFGCQMNVSDSDRIHDVLAPHGYRPTADPAQADLIILNTCSIREKAEQKMASQLGRLVPLKEHNPDLVLAVAGCVAQQEGAKLLKRLRHLDLVLGPDQIGDLPALLERVQRSGERVAETSFFKRSDYRFLETRPKPDQPVTEFVTIMKGCDKCCTYCIVPFTRGREVSKPKEMVLREVRGLVEAGVREVTLLGQNVNSYGKDKAREVHFAELLREVDTIPDLARLRFTTSHPSDCTDELIACFGELRTLCESFHLPVQSGSDRILDGMRRGYPVAHYLDRLDRLRARAPGIALSTDIIVGFPGETEADFEATLALLDRVRFDSIFSFKYSPRPGTKATNLDDDVSEEVKSARLQRVLALQRAVTADRMRGYLGTTQEVLIEGPSRKEHSRHGSWQLMGRTRTNVIVNLPVPLGEFWSRRWIGRLAQAKIEAVNAHSLLGQLS